MRRLSAEGVVVFLALISRADDEGRLHAGPEDVAGWVQPWAQEEVVRASLTQLRHQRMVSFYQHQGEPYIALVNWSRHQRIDRARPSALPAPPTRHREASLNARRALTEDSPKPREGSRSEDRKGSRSDRKGSLHRVTAHARERTEKKTLEGPLTDAVIAQLEGFVRDGKEHLVPARYQPLLADIRARVQGAQA